MLASSRDLEEKSLEALKIHARTVDVRNLRIANLQKILLIVGMFSFFESALKANLGWKKPFEKLADRLQEWGRHELIERLSYYRLANNVLKHGEGPSHKKLLENKHKLDFQIKKSAESFFYEGDVSEINETLIDVTDPFVSQCAELIEQIVEEIYLNEGVQI